MQSFEKGLQTLEEAVGLKYSKVVRDATIQRFEYTFELCWKVLRSYLKEIHGIICNSPKNCFREGFSIGLYNESDTEKFLQMVDDRNDTTQTYDEKIAMRIYKQIKETYYPLLKELDSVLIKQEGE